MTLLGDAVAANAELLADAGLLPIHDPPSLEPPTSEQLTGAKLVIGKTRAVLRQAKARELASDAAYDAQLQLALALTYRGMQNNRFHEAARASTAAIELRRFRWEGCCLRGQISMLRGRKRAARWMGEAWQDFNHALLLEPGSTVARYGRALSREMPALELLEKGQALRAKGNQKESRKLVIAAEEALCEAIGDYDDVVSDNARLGLPLLHRGTCRARLGDLDGATADLDQVVKLGPAGLEWAGARAQTRLAEAFAERGMVALARGESELALEDLGEALERFPAAHERAREIGRRRAAIALQAGVLDEVVREASRLVEDESDPTPLLLLRCRAHYRLGNYELSRADASRILRADGSHMEARYVRACCAAELAFWESAISDFDCCLVTRPRFGECLARRARVLCETGQYERAVADAERALVLDRGNRRALLALGRARHHLGADEGAVAALKRAAAAGSSGASRRLKEWYDLEP